MEGISRRERSESCSSSNQFYPVLTEALLILILTKSGGNPVTVNSSLEALGWVRPS